LIISISSARFRKFAVRIEGAIRWLIKKEYKWILVSVKIAIKKIKRKTKFPLYFLSVKKNDPGRGLS